MLIQHKPKPDQKFQNQQEKMSLSQEQLSVRSAKLKELADIGHRLGSLKEEKAAAPNEGGTNPPGSQSGTFISQSSPGIINSEIRMRHEQVPAAEKRRQQVMIPQDVIGQGGHFPPHMVMGPEGLVDPQTGMVVDPQTGMVIRPPHIPSPGGPRYSSPFPPGFQPGFPPGYMGPGFPVPPQSRPNGHSDQPPPKRTKKSSKKKSTESKQATFSNTTAIAQHQSLVLPPGQHPPRLQTVPSPRQLNALADIDAQELIITRQLNVAYREDLANDQSMIGSPMSMQQHHALMQQHHSRLPPGSVFGPRGGPPVETGRLSHPSLPPGKIDPFLIQQQQHEQMIMQQRMMSDSMMQQFGNDGPPPGFMIPSDQMNQPMLSPGYPGTPGQASSSINPPGASHNRLPPHITNLHIQGRDSGGTVHYMPAATSGPPTSSSAGPLLGPMHGAPPTSQSHMQSQQFLEETYGKFLFQSSLLINLVITTGNSEMLAAMHHGRRMMPPPPHSTASGGSFFDQQQQGQPGQGPQQHHMYQMGHGELPPAFYEQQVFDNPFQGSPGNSDAAVALAQQQQQQQQHDFMFQQQQLHQQMQQSQGLQPQLPDSVSMSAYGNMPSNDQGYGYGSGSVGGPGGGTFPGAEYIGPQHSEFVAQHQQQW